MIRAQTQTQKTAYYTDLFIQGLKTGRPAYGEIIVCMPG